MSGGPDATREFASKLDDPQRWVIKQGVPIFKAHERTDPATGQLIKVDLPKLYRIAGNMQKLERQGGVPIRCTLGHTEPNKSEPEQPPVGGYYKNARVQPFGPKGEPAIVVDEWLDPQYAPVRKNFPYRSAEYYDDAEQITGVALLTRDPFLDLGVVAYERGDSLVCYTAQSQPDRRLNYHRNGQRAPVLYHLVIGETAPIQYNAYGQSVGYAAGYYAGGPPNTGEGADDYRQRQEREYAGSRELALSSMLQHFRPGTLGSGTEQQMVRRQPGEIQGGIARRTDNSAYAAYPEGVANYGNWAPQGGYRPGMAGWPRSQEQQAQDAEFDIPPEVIAEQEAQDAEEARWQAAQVGIRQREARDDTNAAGRNLWGHPTGQFGAPPNLRYGNWQGAATGAVRGGFEGARAGAGKGKYGTAIGAATGAVLGGYEGWQKDPKRATPVKQATPVSSSRYGMAGAAVGGLMGGDLGMDIGGDAASGLIGAGLGAGVGHMAQENMKDPFTMPSGNQGAGRTPLSHGVLNARYAAYPEYYAAYPEYYAAYPEYYAAYPEYYADDHDKVDETFDEDQYSPEDIARMRAEQESHNKNQQRKVSQQEADRKALEGRRNRRKPPPFSTYANQGHQMPPNQYSAPWPGPAYHPHHIGRQHTSAWRFADDQDPAQYGIGGAISGGMTGARLGMMAGPMGAVAGGLGGAAIGGMSGENSTKNARYGAGGSMGSSQYANPLSIGGNIGPIGGSIGIGGGSQNSRYANSGYGRGRPGRYAGEMPGGPPPGGPGSMGPGGSPGGGDPLQQLQMLLMGAVEILGQMTGGGGGGGGGGMGPGGPPPGAGGPPPGPPQGPFPGNEEEQYARYQAARYAQQRRQPGRYAGVGAPVPYGYPAPQRTISGKPVGESMAVSALNYQLQQQGQVIKMLAYERDQADSEACIEAVQRLADQGFPVSEYEVGELKSKSRDQRGAYLNHIATHYQKIGTDNMPQVLGDPTPAGSDPRSGAPTSKDEMEAALKIASASPNDPTAYNKALAQVRYGRDGGMQYGANRIAGYPQGLADASVQAEWTPGNPYGEPSANGHY